ncbi:MAG: class I SAM-dependent methyltransferase [Thiohalorhabdus sp.]|uniref:class I SAM-dependent methyltransferase n=1 Tax=Thiohalorhabdus sp. TaxID=3094134 RepID=UPI00398157E8
MGIRNENTGLEHEQYTPDFADYWDDLVGWEKREEGEGGFYERLLAASNCETVADVACGTGYHAITLAKNGFKVTASDGSENMVRKTEENAKQMGVTLQDTKVVDWVKASQYLGENSYDAVICLGNSFTHLFEHEARRDALEEFFKVVKPGGMVVIDHRNYDSMLEHGYSSKHNYYYSGKGVDAYPAELNRYLARFEYVFPDGAKFQLKMYPLRQDYVSHLLEDAGFINVVRYGDFEKPYDRDEVDFIQQVAYKPRG